MYEEENGEQTLSRGRRPNESPCLVWSGFQSIETVIKKRKKRRRGVVRGDRENGNPTRGRWCRGEGPDDGNDGTDDVGDGGGVRKANGRATTF